jgi:hypothetical protein
LNHLSKLWTMFICDLLVSKIFKTVLMLIGFMRLLFDLPNYHCCSLVLVYKQNYTWKYTIVYSMSTPTRNITPESAPISTSHCILEYNTSGSTPESASLIWLLACIYSSPWVKFICLIWHDSLGLIWQFAKSISLIFRVLDSSLFHLFADRN